MGVFMKLNNFEFHFIIFEFFENMLCFENFGFSNILGTSSRFGKALQYVSSH